MKPDNEIVINPELKMSKNVEKYHLQLIKNVNDGLNISQIARSYGFDPKKEVEIYIAQDVASRTEGLVGPIGVAERLKKMEKVDKLTKDEIVMQIAIEIAQGKFGNNTPELLAEQAIRTALSYQTEGITAAPIEGISKVVIKSNPDGSQYLSIYYSGPIRSAGGTAQGVSVFIADVVRKELGLAKYKATSDEINRMLEEVRQYNKIMHLQLPTSDDEIKFAWKNIPVMISGDPTEKEEIGGYRDIDSMDTNRVRGGACLVLNDGLVGRAKKIMKRINSLEIKGWEWLERIAKGEFVEKVDKEKSDESGKEVKPDYSFIKDALMGRPIFSDPTAIGGFRLRYGHARNTGIAGIGIHPGLMAVSNDYLATGTHVRTERPGKGSIVAPVDSIDGPIVKLKNGTVLSVTSYNQGVRIRDQIEEILFLGDMLVGFGEFIQNNYKLCPVGYNEEWWLTEVNEVCQKKKWDNLDDLLGNPPSIEEAISLSNEFQIPLYPKYLPVWKYITGDEIQRLYLFLNKKGEDITTNEIKLILEKALIPHQMVKKEIIISENYLTSIIYQLNNFNDTELSGKNGLEVIQEISPIKIRDKIGTTIGARMGRPEKAKARKMKKIIHGLYPLGSSKKVNRMLSKAKEVKFINVNLANRVCKKCNKINYYVYCPSCKFKTKPIGVCMNSSCRSKMDEGPCDNCGSRVIFTKNYQVEIPKLIDSIYSRIGTINTRDIKFLDKLKNINGIPEIPEKGVLRARYKLNVFRDGTIRYDATDAPLTHFYPYEVGTSINKLVEIGYTHDVDGNRLISKDQLLELKVQDIIIHKSCFEHLTKVSKFIDDELELIYKLDKYYNIENYGDLIGHLVIGLAPHTSAGVIGRIIGQTSASVCWAHPFWHSSKRRNCDGDEDGIILLLDGFINFSKEYLPSTRGSKMDTPLVLVVNLNPREVDDEAYNLDCQTLYPKELYEAAEAREKPTKIVKVIQRAENRLDTPLQYEGFVFSHSSKNISEGPLASRYKNPNLSIRDKLHEQLELADIIRAVDVKQTARRILERHVLPDLIGNLRAFASQTVRCITCNTKYRRIPLHGKCNNVNCVKSNLVLTVPPKGVSKYIDICQTLVKQYELGTYHLDRLEKIQLALDSHFQTKEDLQLDLTQWLDFD